MRNLFYYLLMLSSTLLFIAGGAFFGCFPGMGLCALIWGEGVIRSALSDPPDYSHPAFWLWFILLTPSMLIGFIGALAIGKLIRMYAAYIVGEKPKPNLLEWLKSVTEVP